jgi:hypothetical protein
MSPELDLRMRAGAWPIATLGSELDLRMRAGPARVALGPELDLRGFALRGAVEKNIRCGSFSTTVLSFGGPAVFRC